MHVFFKDIKNVVLPVSGGGGLKISRLYPLQSGKIPHLQKSDDKSMILNCV